MASQWIRWNQVTHIFEYSTDNGSSFNPLPLNAATITEGAIPDAVLSPNVVMENVANVMTNALPLSIESAAPTIQFRETDQPADGRYWRENFQGGTYRLQSLTDALGATDLLTVDRTGILNLSQNADHIFGGAVGSNISRIRIKNTVSGIDRYVGVTLDTDLANQGILNAFTAGWTTSLYNKAAGVTLSGTGTGGLNLVTTHAVGDMNFWTSGILRMAIFAGGGIDITKSSDPATLRLIRNTTAVSGNPEGGLMFMGIGIRHAGIGFTPVAGAAGSKLYIGFGSSNSIDQFNKNLTMFDSINLNPDGIFQTPWSNGCLMVITHSQQNKCGVFCCSANGAAVEMADPGLGYSNTLNTANMINVYYIGSGIWGIQNKTAAVASLTVNMLGISTV